MFRNFFKKQNKTSTEDKSSYPIENIKANDRHAIYQMLKNAYPNIQKSGAELEWSYNPDIWKPSELHFIIPPEVAGSDEVLQLFKDVHDATIGFNGGAYSWNMNFPGNIIFLPTDNQISGGNPRYFSAIHASEGAVYNAYAGYAKKILVAIRNQFQVERMDPNNLQDAGTPRPVAALRASARIEDAMRFLRAGLVSEQEENVRFFLNNNDAIFKKRFPNG
jgi:hypothetical protein